MHFVFTTVGSAGDVHPFLGLALALKARGHRITFATCGYFRTLAERFGLDFHEIGTAEAFLETTRNPDIWHPTRAFPCIFRTGVAPSLRPQYELVASQYVAGETVAVCNALSFGTRTAHDKLGVPLVTIHCQPAVIWSDRDPPTIAGTFGPRWLKSWMYNLGERMVLDRITGPVLNGFRAELGLPPVNRITRHWHSPTMVGCLFPEWFAPPQPDWPSNLVQTSFPLWDERKEDQLPEGLSEFLSQGDPPIVFTPGSAYVFGSKFFEAAVKACRILNRRGLLLTRFVDQVPRSLPPDVRHESYVPLSLLLPRAAAFVNHGGIGSVSQGMAAGIPQLIMPMAHDQFDNATRLRRLGVGDELSVRKFTGPAVAQRLARLLGAPATSDACRDVAQQMGKTDGLDAMACAIGSRFTGSLTSRDASRGV